jgi:hypothetical protein
MLAQSVASPGYGFAGLWPRIHIISERATDGSDQAPASLVISAIKRCITLDASVINISLTTSDITANERKSFEAAIASALANNIIVVAAAGNDNGGAVQYPAALPGVLAVAASKSSGRTCSLSATGPQIALSAPGCDLDISGADGSLEGGEGTSFSSVYVAAAATALRAYSGLGAAAITNILLHSANDVAGNHVLDIAAAFQEAGLSAMTSSAHAHQRRHQS